MPYLSWITDQDLIECVEGVLAKGLEGISKAESDFSRNGIDPFSALFDASCQQVSLTEWPELERRRQAQKTLQNALGKFHQSLLGKVGDWMVPKSGFIDLISFKNKAVVEIKNKHNTVKKSDLKSVYNELEQAVMHKTSTYKGYTGYYVTIIPGSDKRFSKPFTPSNNETETKKSSNELIQEIDGYSFYALVTEKDDALFELYQVLPTVIEHLIKKPQFLKLIDLKPMNYLKEINFTLFFSEAFGGTVPTKLV
ncbi:MAG: Eco47II family restriction endonuclease [Pseudomonadota bacterium]